MEKKERPLSLKVSILIKNYAVNLPNRHWNFSKTPHLHTNPADNPRMQNPSSQKLNLHYCCQYESLKLKSQYLLRIKSMNHPNQQIPKSAVGENQRAPDPSSRHCKKAECNVNSSKRNLPLRLWFTGRNLGT